MIACKDCRHHDDSWGNCCSHPDVMIPDPVSGHVLETCHRAREAGGKCGPDAKLFTQRNRLRGWFGCSVSSQNGTT